MALAKTLDVEVALLELDKAVTANKISVDAKKNIARWLGDPKYSDHAQNVLQHIGEERWDTLQDIFWTVLPFGTAGRHGRMYPIGCNAINDVTILESAQGLATYVVQQHDPDQPLSCAIAYGARKNSERFAKLCAEVMVAAGFQVYLLDSFRSTPALSFLVRRKRASCGIMVSASHNPPSENAITCYWSNGAQLVPPHDDRVIQEVMNSEEIQQADFDEAFHNGKIQICTQENDAAFVEHVASQGFAGSRDIEILYSPLYGVGETAVVPALQRDGFANVTVFEPHRKPIGDLPNIPGYVSNPEIYADIIEHARSLRAHVVLATDPDCDRLGCASPLTLDSTGDWAMLTGNQMAALLADFVLQKRQLAGDLTPEHFIAKSLVTTELVRRIGTHYGVQTHGELQIGFKWIAEKIDQLGADKFVFGGEESHGYLVGNYARERDGTVAVVLMAELVAELKARGQTLHQRMDELYRIHGYYADSRITKSMPGPTGIQKARLLMHRFRENPPEEIAGERVISVRDYQSGTYYCIGEPKLKFEGPKSNMVVIEMENYGNAITIQPNGLDATIEFYPTLYDPADLSQDLSVVKRQAMEKLERIYDELAAVTDQI